MTLTAEQIQDLREEFVDFKINEMSREEMADWIRTVYLDELERCTVDELEYEINSYDDNLYELLIPLCTGQRRCIRRTTRVHTRQTRKRLD